MESDNHIIALAFIDRIVYIYSVINYKQFMNKKDKIVEMFEKGKTIREIMAETGCWDSYIRPVIKMYKLEKELKTLKKI